MNLEMPAAQKSQEAASEYRVSKEDGVTRPLLMGLPESTGGALFWQLRDEHLPASFHKM